MYVLIVNTTPTPVRVFLRKHSQELPLGNVSAMSSRAFQVELGFLTNANLLEILARDRSGGTVLRSEAFTLGPARRVSWRLAPASSQIDVR
jgi:hypothetical protein